MADHLAITPSQVAHPGRAVLRTVVQVGLVLFGFVLAAGPAILNILAEDLGAHLPPGVITWMLTAAAALTALSGAVARIMALPRVNELLGRIRLDAGNQVPSVTGGQVPGVNSPAEITRTTNK
jgi:hypothetical protein